MGEARPAGAPSTGGGRPDRGGSRGGSGHRDSRGPSRRPAPRSSRPENSSVDSKHILPPAEGVLRIIPLGGVEEIGKNMTAIEYGDEIIVVDAGLQFGEVETPGVDFILPDVTYLKDRKEKIKAMFITHGHLDHIGAIPFVIEDMGNPPIYTRAFGSLMIAKRQTEFPTVEPLNLRTIQGDERMQIGKNFVVNFFAISHAIPDSMGLLIETPVGTIAFIEDVRVDHVDGKATQLEIDHYEIFKDKKILLFTLDSTSVEKPGFSIPESYAIETIDRIMRDATGRLIIGTFASNVERIIQMVMAANKYGKKIVVDGRSMKSNLEIVKQLELVDMSNMIPIEEMLDHPPSKIVVLATGAQGEEYAVFDRIANKTHKFITLSPSDTILFSSSVIPGNEMAIQKLKDNLYRQDGKIITYLDTSVHASGHGNRGELSWIHHQMDYKFFIPLHGHHYMLKIHKEVAIERGTPAENVIVPDNGSIIEIYDNGEKIRVLDQKAPSNLIMVDGFSVGGTQEVVLRDRQALAEEGIFVIVVSVNPKTGKLRKSPDIISRGFVYLKEQQELISATRSLVARSVERTSQGMNPINFDMVKNTATDEVRKFLFQKTGKSPIVIPVIIGI
jgi:ribonuclease J